MDGKLILKLYYKKEKVNNQYLQGFKIEIPEHKIVSLKFKVGNQEMRMKPFEEVKSQLIGSEKVTIISNFLETIDDFNKLINKNSFKKVKSYFSNIQDIEVIKEEDSLFISQFESEKNKLIEYQKEIKEIEKIKKLVTLEVVEKSKTPLVSTVNTDDYTRIAEKCFDYKFEGINEFYPYLKPSNIADNFNLGVIVGASGSGKSTVLKEFGENEEIPWDDSLSIMSHFDSPEDAIDKLSAVGLNSIPTWTKPYKVLSTGEKFRADLARRIKHNAVIDEFTSVVDRNVAKATSTAFSKYIKNNDIKGVVLATCHEDIIEWLEPDWIFNTNEGVLYDGKSLRRPKIELEIYETSNYNLWETFKEHHYLSSDLNKASRKFIAVLNGEIIGFNAVLTLPNGKLKNAWRGHRTVILPDYQGLGIGVAFSDAIGQIHIEEGKRYYSKTSHIRMGMYREKSSLWRATVENKRKRTTTPVHKGGTWFIDLDRIAFSHEYIGYK